MAGFGSNPFSYPISVNLCEPLRPLCPLWWAQRSVNRLVSLFSRNPLKLSQTDLATRGNLYTMMVSSRKKDRYMVKSPDGEVEEIFTGVDDVRLPVEESEEAQRLSKFD